MRLDCSSMNCLEEASEALTLRGQAGHVHDCAKHAAGLREWCDVTFSAPIVEGVCPAVGCTGNRAIAIGYPTPLEG